MSSRDLSLGITRISLSQRLYLIVLQAILLLVTVAMIVLYVESVDSGERAALSRRALRAEELVQDLESDGIFMSETAEALVSNLRESQRILTMQQSRSTTYTRTILTVTLAGVVIVVCMSYLIIRGVLRKYPELLEER